MKFPPNGVHEGGLVRGELAAGLIFEIALAAGMELPPKGEKRTIHCPFHDDRNASAFVSAVNIFYCSVCTPGAGWSAKRFCEALDLDWKRFRSEPDFAHARGRVAPVAAGQERPFTPADAQAIWKCARARARDDDAAERDLAVYEYLGRRGLQESWEVGAFGVLPPGELPHPSLKSWHAGGYRVIAPLFDHAGAVVGVQARRIVEGDPKTRVPKGCPIKGSFFADSRAQELLRGERRSSVVVLGEGLTDMLALAIVSQVPVIAAPGVNVAVDAVGSWAEGRSVLLALDCDQTGDAAVNPVARALQVHGAQRARRVVWPSGAKDACDVIARRGIIGLEDFLNAQVTQVQP